MIGKGEGGELEMPIRRKEQRGFKSYGAKITTTGQGPYPKYESLQRS